MDRVHRQAEAVSSHQAHLWPSSSHPEPKTEPPDHSYLPIHSPSELQLTQCTNFLKDSFTNRIGLSFLALGRQLGQSDRYIGNSHGLIC